MNTLNNMEFLLESMGFVRTRGENYETFRKEIERAIEYTNEIDESVMDYAYSAIFNSTREIRINTKEEGFYKLGIPERMLRYPSEFFEMFGVRWHREGKIFYTSFVSRLQMKTTILSGDSDFVGQYLCGMKEEVVAEFELKKIFNQTEAIRWLYEEVYKDLKYCAQLIDRKIVEESFKSKVDNIIEKIIAEQ